MGIIRILLAFAVIFEHIHVFSGKVLVPGNIAVELFFIISGYYMAMVLAKGTYQVKSRAKPLSFYKSRFFRLYPTFITITIASLLYSYLLWVALGQKPANDTDILYERSTIWVGPLAFISNLTMLGQDLFSLFHILPTGEIRMFYARNVGSTPDGAIWLGNLRIIGQAWSIGTEIWFYLLVPFLNRLKPVFLGIIALFSIALKLYFELGLDFETYFFFPGQLYLFVLGMLVFHVNENKSYSKKYSKVALMVIIFLIVIHPLLATIEYRVFLYLVFILNLDACFKLTKSNKSDRLIGNLSYPLYLIHMLVIQFTINLFNYFNLQAPVFLSILSVVLSFLAALVIYYLIEIPFDRFRVKFKSLSAE